MFLSAKIIPAIMAAVILMSVSATAQETAIPIPQGSDVVIWMRGDQVASDPDLKASVLRNRAVGRYLDLLNLALEQIDYAVLFSPFDRTWIAGGRRAASDKLPSGGAMIVAGNFDPKNKYESFKSKGWLKQDYSNKKLLWWSTGESYYRNPKGGECVGYLPGGRLVVTGSEAIMKELLDVSGKKKEGLASEGTYQRLGVDFFASPQTVMSAFVNVTAEMRSMIKADTVNLNSAAARNAIEYIDHLKESGLTAVKEGSMFMVNGYLGMDNQNNALVVASLLQIGGGLANLLPQGDPNRALLSNLTVSRQERTVTVQTPLNRQQLVNLIR